MRNIKLNVVHEEFLDNEFEAAIGYLSTWAIHSPRYENVSIYSTSPQEISAVYSDAAGIVTYEMLAVRREDGTYSFHS